MVPVAAHISNPSEIIIQNPPMNEIKFHFHGQSGTYVHVCNLTKSGWRNKCLISSDLMFLNLSWDLIMEVRIVKTAPVTLINL